ncbi:MAG: ClcB-like voltage-gated chloride channel protein [Gammaproteobacteria bacterium]|nr:ClcB-like voltage-gated chloride channel protein [Gammaproteobacteria bacterium]
MHVRAQEFARVPLSLLTRARLVLFGHEDLAGIVFWATLVGLSGALASVIFRELIRLFTKLFTGYTSLIEHGSGLVGAASSLVWWHRALVPIVGGVLAGSVLYFIGRTFVSHKAVDYIEAVKVGDGRIGFRASILKSFASLLTISSGGSIGREGSMVQLAAMLGSRLGMLAGAPIPRLRLMVACGVAAGIAAAYNAPLSGALFASEIVLGSTSMESFGPLVISSVIASSTIRRFLGYGPVFDVPLHVFAPNNWELIFYVFLGVLLGHLAPPFLALIDFAKAQFVRLKLPLYWQLGLGGVVVGSISAFVPQVWGNGYSVVSQILNGQVFGLWLLVILLAKVLATSATVGSGGVGGVLTPSLFVGAAVGSLLGGVFHNLMPHIASVPAAYALVGMGGFLAATTQAPLTSIMMIFEMTLDYDILLPLMLACVAAHYTAKVYRKGQSVYHATLNRAIVAEDGDDWRLRTVESLVKPPAAVVTASTSLADIFDQLPKRPLQRVYLTNGDDLIAWFDPRKMLERLQKGDIDWGTPAEGVALPVNFALSPDMSLCEALDGFLREQATTLPVTPGQWRHTLLGEVSRSDVLLAIQDRLTFPK